MNVKVSLPNAVLEAVKSWGVITFSQASIESFSHDCNLLYICSKCTNKTVFKLSDVRDAIISILIRSVIFKKESEGGINKK